MCLCLCRHQLNVCTIVAHITILFLLSKHSKILPKKTKNRFFLNEQKETLIIQTMLELKKREFLFKALVSLFNGAHQKDNQSDVLKICVSLCTREWNIRRNIKMNVHSNSNWAGMRTKASKKQKKSENLSTPCNTILYHYAYAVCSADIHMIQSTFPRISYIIKIISK